jgi:hypothetical protein
LQDREEYTFHFFKSVYLVLNSKKDEQRNPISGYLVNMVILIATFILMLGGFYAITIAFVHIQNRYAFCIVVSVINVFSNHITRLLDKSKDQLQIN